MIIMSMAHNTESSMAEISLGFLWKREYTVNWLDTGHWKFYSALNNYVSNQF